MAEANDNDSNANNKNGENNVTDKQNNKKRPANIFTPEPQAKESEKRQKVVVKAKTVSITKTDRFTIIPKWNYRDIGIQTENTFKEKIIIPKKFQNKDKDKNVAETQTLIKTTGTTNERVDYNSVEDILKHLGNIVTADKMLIVVHLLMALMHKLTDKEYSEQYILDVLGASAPA